MKPLEYLYYVSDDGVMNEVLNDGGGYSHVDYQLWSSKPVAWASYINKLENDLECDVEKLKHMQQCLDAKGKLLDDAKDAFYKYWKEKSPD